MVQKVVDDLNMEAEIVEKLQKDEWKQKSEKKLMQAHADLHRQENGCAFRTQTKAGLNNYP